MSATELRPLRVGEVLDAAIKVYTRNARELFKTVLVVLVPFEILAAIVLASEVSGTTLSNGKFLFATQSDLTSYTVSSLVLTLLVVLVVLLANAACFKAVSDTYLGEAPNWRQSLAFAFRRLGSVLWLSIVTFVVLVLAIIALVLPGIYLAVAFSVALPVLLVEGTGGFKALRRSLALTRGRWWATLGTILVAAVLIAVVQLVVGLILGLIGGLVFPHATGGSPVARVILQRVLDTFGRMISIPFFAACVTVIYYDLRVRKEGYDLQLLAEGIGRAAPSSGAAPEPAAPSGDHGAGVGSEPAERGRSGGSIPPPAPSG